VFNATLMECEVLEVLVAARTCHTMLDLPLESQFLTKLAIERASSALTVNSDI
jgi:hypothetical protein